MRSTDDQLYTLEATKAEMRKDFFLFVQYLSPAVITALRALAESFLDDTCTAVLFFELYSMAAKNTWEWDTRIEGRGTSLVRRAMSTMCRSEFKLAVSLERRVTWRKAL